MQPVQLGELLSQLVLAMQPQAQAAGVELFARFSAPGAVTLADPDRLKEAFGNLIDNAIKYTPRGGRVTVELAGSPQGIQVLITDTGPGIPPQDLPRVMERFYQVDKARSSTDGRSIGLGLAIAREIIMAHQGQIHLESVQGKGTTVRVTLPARLDNRAVPKQRTHRLFGRQHNPPALESPSPTVEPRRT
jgi:signal transduction histidine kinase